MLEGLDVIDQPVVLNGKLYARSLRGNTIRTVVQYTPDSDHWDELPPPPVKYFTIATLSLRGQLLVVGGVNSTGNVANTILTFNEHSQQWVQSYSDMPTARTYPTVIGYQDHLIVAGGLSSRDLCNVDILNTTSNQWITAQPLPSPDDYNIVLAQDIVFLVGVTTKTVLQAHVAALISGAKSGVWKTVANTPYYFSSPITIGNTFLTVGGSDSLWDTNPTTSIQMYNTTNIQWKKVGDLPEPMSVCHCTVLSGKLFAIGVYGFISQHVYVATAELPLT